MTGARVGIVAVAVLAGCARSHAGAGYECAGSPCDDGDPCNGVETCDTVAGCLPGTPMTCRDLDPCTVDGCTAGACTHTPRDLDADGHADPCAGGDDCAPLDPTAYPGAPELCNDRDDDCDLGVDEGLPFGLVSETVLPEDVWYPAFLDDGSLAGMRNEPGLYPAPLALEAYVGRGDEMEIQTVQEPAFGFDSPYPLEVLYGGDRAVAAFASAPLLDDFLGQRWRSAQWVQVFEIRPGRDPIATELATYRPEDGELAQPLGVDADWIGDVPVVVWTDLRRGVWRLRVAVVDGRSPAYVLSESTHPFGSTIASDPAGATLLWREDGSLRATRVGAAGAPSAGADLLVDEWVSDACALPSGTAVTFRNSEQPIFIEIYVLGRDLALLGEPLAVLPEPRSEGGHVGVHLSCIGSSVLVLNSFRRFGDPEGYAHHRLRRVTAEGLVDFDEDFDSPSVRFGAARRPTLIVAGEDWTEVARTRRSRALARRDRGHVQPRANRSPRG